MSTRDLGILIRARRYELGLDQGGFGRLIGKSRNTISYWESGRAKCIGAEHLARWATVLEIDRARLARIVAYGLREGDVAVPEAGASIAARLPPWLTAEQIEAIVAFAWFIRQQGHEQEGSRPKMGARLALSVLRGDYGTRRGGGAPAPTSR